MLSMQSHIRIRHRIVVSPLLDLFKVPAHMMRFIVRPRTLLSRHVMESEDVDIGQTHQVHSKDFNTVIWYSVRVFDYYK